jgi:SAM-dependent methyltransferase
MVPELAPVATFWEHVYRYRLATRWVGGKDVLDIACGEGYGTSAILASGARSVLGVDISLEACQHATRRYGVETRQGSAEEIPCGDGSFDVVVSFETIEHVERPERFLRELVRVLRPGGRLIISTPNRDLYREVDPANRYHLSEMTPAEFQSALAAGFSGVEMYFQTPRRCRWWSGHLLAAETGAQHRIRGYRRLVRFLRQLRCRHILELEENQRYRLDPVRTILAGDLPDCPWLNPFVGVPFSRAEGVEATYLIAVATRR